MQARYYDAVAGRFLSVDPVTFMGSGYNPAYFNRYAYSGNDPINNIDPDGQFFGAAGKLVKLAIKGGDIGATFAGAAADTKTLFSSDASGLQRLGAAASLATEIFSPVSARDAKAGAGFVQKKLGGTCCFVAGTLVETEFGLRPIEEIELGDKVLARNPETGETALKSVTDLIRLNERQIWEVSLSGNEGASEFFETTDDHPWWVVDQTGQGSWKDTAELSAGMIVTTADYQTMIITNVLETERIDATYNLTVADFETYFVGENKVLVHNCDTLRKMADERAAAGHTGAVSELRTKDGQVFRAHSGEMAPNDEVTGVIMGLKGKNADFAGGCSEAACISKAITAGANPSGGSMRTLQMGKTRSSAAHGSPKKACSTCQGLGDHFDIDMK